MTTATVPLVNFRYVGSEIGRVWRNARFIVFSLALPALLFAAFSAGDQDERLGGLTVAPYIMISMATFGAMNGVFSIGGRIGMERATGWNRQLRLTALTGRQYLAGKVLTGFTVALPGMIAVFLLGHFARDVDLPAGRWALAGVSILFALLPIAALGCWIGYLVRPENLQAVAGSLYSLLALTGGLWVPADTFPSWLETIVKMLPMYWAAFAGRAVIAGDWLGWRGVATVVVWTAILGACAVRAYRVDQLRT